jgi:uncharacterized protein
MMLQKSSPTKLTNRTRQTAVAESVELAATFWQRSRGLLGRSGLPAGHTLWIQGTKWVACNSIHTFFMRFTIDAVFVDRDLKVKKIYRDLKPWRMTWPVAGANSVFEFSAGSLKDQSIEVGDQLYVGD